MSTEMHSSLWRSFRVTVFSERAGGGSGISDLQPTAIFNTMVHFNVFQVTESNINIYNALLAFHCYYPSNEFGNSHLKLI